MAKTERSPGVWQIKIYVGQNASGQKRYEYFTFRGSFREADAEEIRLKNLYGIRNRTMTNLTITELCDLYMANHVKINLRQKTQSDYSIIFERRVKPLIGHIKAIKLTPVDVQYFIRATSRTRLDGKQTPVSSRTIQKAFRTLHSLLEWCRQTGYIQINPAGAVKAPKVVQRIAPTLTVKQALELLDESKKTSPRKYYLLYLLAIGTGARRGELLALRWEDINFKEQRISVQKSFTKASNRSQTKNESSNRTVEVPVFVLEELQKDYALSGDPKELLFAGVDYSNAIKRDFKPLIKRLGLPEELRFHDLRHAHASFLLAAGVDMKQISHQLGHAKIGTTFDIYTHLLSTKEVASKLDGLMGKNP